MLVDVTFPIFMPSKQWSKAFEEMNYDTDKVTEKYGTPFVSNQLDELKLREGIYYTGLNPESWFKAAELDIVPPYATGFDQAHAIWKYRNERGMRFIPLWEIAQMYTLATYGSLEHEEYGVCDNEEQILKTFPHILTNRQRHFITMTPIYRKNEPEKDGWRWSKWGEYIGTHDIKHEYLYDEKDIEVVHVFHIYTLQPESGLGSMPVEMISQKR